MKNYEHLEGKVIKFVTGDKIFDARVSLIDHDIGITLVDANDKDNYLSCLIMPGSPKWNKSWNVSLEEVESDFQEFISFIEEGVFTVVPVGMDALLGCKVSAEHCPF